MDLPYERHLDELHAGFATDDDVIRAIMADISPASITRKRRIVAGEANEVYDITLADGHDVILRISQGSRRGFEQERWAITQCRLAGVKAPEILLTKTMTNLERPFACCVQRKVEGVTLTRTVVEGLPPSERRTIANEIGVMLVRIHSIATAGRGYIDGDGRGTAVATLAGLETMEADYVRLAERAGMKAATMRAILAELMPAWRATPASGCLVHNDFRGTHVMVDGARMSGIIDWGEVASGEPADDFAEWAYWDGDHLPLAWLLDAYRRQRDLDDSFPCRLRLKQLEYGLCLLAWYEAQKFEEGIGRAVAKLSALLESASR